MIKMNNLMRIKIEEANKFKDEKKFRDPKKIEKICENILKYTKLIQGCVIYDEHNMFNKNDKKLNISDGSNFSIYEYDCSEIVFQLNSIYDNEILLFIDTLLLKLTQKYHNKKFCVIVCINKWYFIVRFHVYRENEGLPFSDNLDLYDDPIIYKIG